MTDEPFEIAIKARMYHGKLKRIVDDNGGLVASAKLLGLSSHTLGNWVRMNYCPFRKGKRINQRIAKAIAKLCRIGKCKARDLWPEWFSGVLPLKKEVNFSGMVEPARLLGMKRVPLKMLPAPQQETVIEKNEQREFASEIIAKCLSVLPARYRDILRFRILDGHTLEECAERFGITGSRVREIEKRALSKIRQSKQYRESKELLYGG